MILQKTENFTKMIVYTADQVFDIIGSVHSSTDLIEIEHYILSNQTAYKPYLIDIWQLCINDLYSILK